MAIKMGKNNSLIPQKRPNPAIKVGRSPFFQTKVGRNQLPERVLRGELASSKMEEQWQKFLEINGLR